VSDPRARFLQLALSNPNNRIILQRAAALELPDWWLTAGALFQTVWNALDCRPPATGILDYDLFYLDGDDLSAAAETEVNRAAAQLFSDRDIVVEARNEARVHLWYEQDFGVPGRRFQSSRDAIDHFAATTCCFAITRRLDGELEVYAPFGYEDLLSRRVRPNPVLAPRDVYEAKAGRWKREWPMLDVEPWPTNTAHASLPSS